MEKEILIFGHKNPDTDSICSAMVKERLNKKNRLEKKQNENQKNSWKKI